MADECIAPLLMATVMVKMMVIMTVTFMAMVQALTRVKKVNSRVEREILNSDLEFRE